MLSSGEQKSNLLYQGWKLLLKSIHHTWKTITVIVVIVGIIANIYAFSPKVKVYSNIPMKPDKAIKHPFIIENNSTFRVTDISFTYLFRKIESKGPSWQSTGNDVLTATDLPTTTLNSGEQTTAFCISGISYKYPVTSADVEIIISYRYFGKHIEHFRFATFPDKNENLIWTPKAMAEK